MILRGIDRAHDVDLGPSNGQHTRGPVSGGLVQPAAPIPSGRKGVVMGPRKATGGWSPERRSEAPPRDYSREYRARKRVENPQPPRVECGQKLRSFGGRASTDGSLCARRLGHVDHCKSRMALDNESIRRRSRA